jgi:predicted glycosyltransferase
VTGNQSSHSDRKVRPQGAYGLLKFHNWRFSDKTLRSVPIVPSSLPIVEKPLTDDPQVGCAKSVTSRKIWIDLDNSPHVPFFLPIIGELKRRGHHVLLTARNAYQVRELAEFFHLETEVLGGHWGKNGFLKVLGTGLRAVQLWTWIVRNKPDLAVSHGSRSQLLSALAARVPVISIWDYEHSRKMVGPIMPDWAFVPHVIPESVKVRSRRQSFRYPGIKENVYVAGLEPDPAVRGQLGIDETDLVVTIRPPAIEAHYHNAEAESLLDAALNLLTQRPDIRIILLPRNQRQAVELRKQWEPWISKRKIIIPEHVLDGLNLIWLSDLVISGGGTMNREAAALGVPVYSIFRGPLGAVDRHLAETHRLTLLETAEDVRTRIDLKKRARTKEEWKKQSPTLNFIVEKIISIAENGCA